MAEAGAMMYMQDGIEMKTTLDPERPGRRSMVGKLLGGAQAGAHRRVVLHDAVRQPARPTRDVAFAAAAAGQDLSVSTSRTGAAGSSPRRTRFSARRGVFTSRSRSRSAWAPASSAARGSSSSASRATVWCSCTPRARSCEMELAGRRDGCAWTPAASWRSTTERGVRHPDGAGHQDGAVRRRGAVLRHADRTRAGDPAVACRSPAWPTRSSHRRRGRGACTRGKGGWAAPSGSWGAC